MALNFAPVQGSDWMAQLNKNFETIAKGAVTELASDAETIAGVLDTKVVTPAGLQAKVASDAETIAGVLDTKVVTPAGLQAKVASDAAKGIVELATNAEALTGTDAERALTAANLASVLGNLDLISFVGINGAGACTMTGVKVGDLVLAVTGAVAGDVGSQGTKFESAITVEDEIQQSDVGDLSNKVFVALILRKS